MRESEIENYTVDLLKSKGYLVRKVRWVARAGAPDRIVMGFGHVFFIEFKAPGKKLRLQQEREIRRMRDKGVIVYLIDSKRKAYELFAR